MVGPLDPGDDGDAQLVFRRPAVADQQVLTAGSTQGAFANDVEFGVSFQKFPDGDHPPVVKRYQRFWYVCGPKAVVASYFTHETVIVWPGLNCSRFWPVFDPSNRPEPFGPTTSLQVVGVGAWVEPVIEGDHAPHPFAFWARA